MAMSRGAAERKRRMDELESERQKIEAEISKVQKLGRLSELNNRLAEIKAETKRLAEE